jgi:hypothetical protein
MAPPGASVASGGCGCGGQGNQFTFALYLNGIRIAAGAFLKSRHELLGALSVAICEQGIGVFRTQYRGVVSHGLHELFLLPVKQSVQPLAPVLPNEFTIDSVAGHHAFVQTNDSELPSELGFHQLIRFDKGMSVHQTVGGKHAQSSRHAVVYLIRRGSDKPFPWHILEADTSRVLLNHLHLYPKRVERLLASFEREDVVPIVVNSSRLQRNTVEQRVE